MVNDRSKAHAGDAASQDRNGTPVSRHEREKVFYTVQDLRELVEEIPNPSVALQAILRDFPEPKGVAILRPDKQVNLTSSKRTQNLEAIGIQITGRLDDRGPCTACSEGKGHFVDCFTLGEGIAMGACGNCHYNSKGSKCSYRTQRREQGRDMKDDNDNPQSDAEQAGDEAEGLKHHGATAKDKQKRKRRSFWDSEISLFERDTEYDNEELGEDSEEEDVDQPPHKHRNRHRRARRRINYEIDMTMPDTDSDDLLSDREQLLPEPMKAACTNNNIDKNTSPGNRRSYSLPLNNGGGAPPKFGFNLAQFKPANASPHQVRLQHPSPAGVTAGVVAATAEPQVAHSAMRARQLQVEVPQQPLVMSQQSSQRPGPAAPLPASSAPRRLIQGNRLQFPPLRRPSPAQAPTEAPQTRPSFAPAQGPTQNPLSATIPNPPIPGAISGAQAPLPQSCIAQAHNPVLTPIPTQYSSPFIPATQAPQTAPPRPAFTVHFPFTSNKEARRFARMLHHVAVALEDAVTDDDDAA